MLNVGVINKYIIDSGIAGGVGYLLLVNYQSLHLNIFPLAPPHNYFSL